MVAHQGVQHAREGATPVNLFTEQREHRPGLRIGIHVDGARGEAHIPHRDPVEPGAAVGCVETAPLQTLAHRLECDCTSRPL